MLTPPSSDSTPNVDGKGVLASLPRARPQRASARRTAARAGTGGEKASNRAKRGRSSGRATASSSRVPKSATGATGRPPESAPRQGFATDDDASGPVTPPGGVEFLAAAAELVSGLAKTGLSVGGRLIKDALSRMPVN